jgi:ATP-dependent Clp protease ATP-binding subunit ClpA
MTSNIGSPHLTEEASEKGEISERARSKVMGELRVHFRPEFLNRVDEIVLFKPLTRYRKNSRVTVDFKKGQLTFESAPIGKKAS